jgi:hypothetical protein
MGRNKLKSFGPLMCQMAMLVHVRSGSFFFKALGITLLFMAGFPDDLVQKETKYQNLDLLQKYYRFIKLYIYSKQLWYHKYRMYRMAMLVHVLIHSHLRKHMEILTLKGNLCSFGRTDEDAEGEDLFFQHISAYNDVRSQIPY